MDEDIYWLIISENFWLFPTRVLDEIFKKFGSLKSFFQDAEEKDLDDLKFSQKRKKKIIGLLDKFREKDRIAEFMSILEELRRINVTLIRYIDDSYPSQLKKIHWPLFAEELWNGSLGKKIRNPSLKKRWYNLRRLDAPRLIYHKGSLRDFRRCIGVGGTRKCSDNGRKIAYEIGRMLAEEGFTVVSGLAVGIDTAVHRGALDASDKTIAVLPWMNPIYPRKNEKLSRDIMRNGALISECYLKPKGRLSWRFVERSKIIAGLSEFVVLVEPGSGEGTFWLGDIAMLLGRKVLVLKWKEMDEKVKKGYDKLEKELNELASILGRAKPIIMYSCEELLNYLKEKRFSSENRKLKFSCQTSLNDF